MKKLRYFFVFAFILFFGTNASSQWIISKTVIPALPTSTDTVYVLIECEFPSGSCDEHTQGFFVSGNVIYGNALHCLGMLSFICDYTDTFMLMPMNTGMYKFYFQLETGLLPSPCTPGIVPGPVDSISFEVSDLNSVKESISSPTLSFFPNPGSSTLFIKRPVTISSTTTLNLQIQNPEGSIIKSKTLDAAEDKVDISELPNGIYFLSLIVNNQVYASTKFVVSR